MRYISIALVLVVVAVLASGCMQTPATVKAAEQTYVPTLLQTLFPTPTPTEYERPTFAPVRTVASKPVVASAATVKPAQEPIIGKWALIGDGNYDCTVMFRDDNTGGIGCAVGYISMSNEQVEWSVADDDYTFMKSYSVRKLSNGVNYTMLYSYRKDTLTSEILPENTYLMRLK